MHSSRKGEAWHPIGQIKSDRPLFTFDRVGNRSGVNLAEKPGVSRLESELNRGRAICRDFASFLIANTAPGRCTVTCRCTSRQPYRCKNILCRWVDHLHHKYDRAIILFVSPDGRYVNGTRVVKCQDAGGENDRPKNGNDLSFDSGVRCAVHLFSGFAFVARSSFANGNLGRNAEKLNVTHRFVNSDSL